MRRENETYVMVVHVVREGRGRGVFPFFFVVFSSGFGEKVFWLACSRELELCPIDWVGLFENVSQVRSLYHPSEDFQDC